MLLGWIVVSIGMCIAVYDAMHMRIPVLWNYALVSVSALYVVSDRSVETVVYAAYGAAVVGGLFLLTFIVSRGRVLGFGDVVLAVSMGMLLGAFDGLLAVWVACVLGSVYGVGQIVLRTGSMDRQAPTKKILQHQVPFGPFLIAGLLVVFLKYASFEGLFDMVPLLTLYSL